MNLNTTTIDGTAVVTVTGARIDSAAAIQFKDAVRAATDDGPLRTILDMSQVTFVDSSGLGAIVAVMKQMGAGRTLDLAGLTPNVDKVFRLTRMDTVFNIYDSVDHAIQKSAAG